MCGIGGIVAKQAGLINLPALKKMSDVIVNRGPDGEGQWISDNGRVGFTHRRLSVIDLSADGAQPMHYLNGRYTITFNGEIYNYLEIKAQLINKNYTFSSSSDTEVLLALYDLKKEKCLDDLDGMFSFAIWDEKEQLLFCARDRFGEKPFHYHLNTQLFAFCSEIKQLWSIGIEKKVSNEKLLGFLRNGQLDNGPDETETFYENIKILDAAHYMIVRPDLQISIKKYWQLSNVRDFTGTIDAAATEFFQLFENSVKVRLRSDVPVGSSLSGGLDSSSIVMLIDKLKGDGLKQNSFSARFKDFAKDEGAYVELVAKSCRNLEVHYTWPDEKYFQQVFDEVIFHQDEPFGSASVVAQYAVMQCAKENNVTVLLDGQGADEQLAGYINYYHLFLDQLYYSDRKKFRNELISYQEFHSAAGSFRTTVNETWRMKAGRYKRKLTGKEGPYDHLLSERLRDDTTRRGLKELLRYADRNSMAHSREVRLPFLSHRLVEFVFSLPDEYKIHQGWTKYVLRKAMTDILPEPICWRVDKIGYEPPQNKWLKSPFFQEQIEQAAKQFGINRVPVADNSLFNQDWRLLMTSRFL